MKDTAPSGKGAVRRRFGLSRKVHAASRPLRIADVGANPINVPAYADLLTLGGCEVWGFEPDAAAFAALSQAARPNAHFVQRAVGRPGQSMFYGHRLSGLGSLYRVDETSSRIGRLRPSMTRDQMVDADAIYVRDFAQPDALCDTQLTQLAVLADSVFTTMDVVLRCMDLLFDRSCVTEVGIDTYIDKLPRKFRVASD